MSKVLQRWLGLFVTPFFDGWVLMLTLALLHKLDGRLPAFGYWVCVLLAFIFAWLVDGPVGRIDYLRNGTLK